MADEVTRVLNNRIEELGTAFNYTEYERQGHEIAVDVANPFYAAFFRAHYQDYYIGNLRVIRGVASVPEQTIVRSALRDISTLQAKMVPDTSRLHKYHICALLQQFESDIIAWSACFDQMFADMIQSGVYVFDDEGKILGYYRVTASEIPVIETYNFELPLAYAHELYSAHDAHCRGHQKESDAHVAKARGYFDVLTKQGAALTGGSIFSQSLRVLCYLTTKDPYTGFIRMMILAHLHAQYLGLALPDQSDTYNVKDDITTHFYTTQFGYVLRSIIGTSSVTMRMCTDSGRNFADAPVVYGDLGFSFKLTQEQVFELHFFALKHVDDIFGKNMTLFLDQQRIRVTDPIIALWSTHDLLVLANITHMMCRSDASVDVILSAVGDFYRAYRKNKQHFDTHLRFIPYFLADRVAWEREIDVYARGQLDAMTPQLTWTPTFLFQLLLNTLASIENDVAGIFRPKTTSESS